MTRRQSLLLLALTATAVLYYLDTPVQEAATPAPSAPALRQSAQAAVSRQSPAPMILEIQPRSASTTAGDVFSAHSWTPPPPPPAPAPVVKPTAPAIPFTVLGKKQENGTWEVFLGRQDRTYIVKTKDVIEGMYRVEAINPPTMMLTYLPLNESQSLPIGGVE